jgi:hypothetical protein
MIDLQFFLDILPCNFSRISLIYGVIFNYQEYYLGGMGLSNESFTGRG